MKISRIAAIGALAAACSQPPSDVVGPNCADVSVPAFTLIALDMMTRQPVNVRAVVVARDGAYADTASSAGVPPVYAMAYDRPGTYSISLDLPGYRSWSTEGLVAQRTSCNVATVALAAWLLPVGNANVQLNDH